MPIVQIGEVDLSCLPLLFIERQKLKVNALSNSGGDLQNPRVKRSQCVGRLRRLKATGVQKLILIAQV